MRNIPWALTSSIMITTASSTSPSPTEAVREGAPRSYASVVCALVLLNNNLNDSCEFLVWASLVDFMRFLNNSCELRVWASLVDFLRFLHHMAFAVFALPLAIELCSHIESCVAIC